MRLGKTLYRVKLMKHVRVLLFISAYWLGADKALPQGRERSGDRSQPAVQPAAQQPTKEELDKAFYRGVQLLKEEKPREALPFFEKAADLAPHVFGPKDLRTASLLYRLGNAYVAVSSL